MTAELKAFEGRYHFRRRLILLLFPAAISLSALSLWIAWDLFDPDWFPTGRRKTFIADLLYLLPWWIRGSLFVLPVAIGIVISAAYVFHALDRKPDFTIGSAGITRNFLFRRFTFPWPDIESVSAENSIVEIKGSAVIRSKRRQTTITYNPLVFGRGSGEVLTLIRHYRPDLISDELIRSTTEEISIRQIPRA